MNNLMELIKHVETGKITRSQDFNMKKIAPLCMQLQKDYQIEFPVDPFSPIDKHQIENLWFAGAELLSKTGFLNTSNRRQILIEQENIGEALRSLPESFTLGKGLEQRKIYAKIPCSGPPPIIFGGSFNTDIEESLFIKFTMAYAQERLIDVMYNPGYLRALDGVELRINSPLEMQAVIRRASMTREALRRAGRPDMPVITQSSSFCGLGSYNPEWGFRKSDMQYCAMNTPLTLDDSLLTKVTFFTACGIPIGLGVVPLIGGFGGGPASTAILTIAEFLLATLFGANMIHFGPQHVHFGQQSNHQSLWVARIVNQAVSLHSKIIHSTTIIPAARPGDPQYFTEIAAQTLAAVITGAHVTGPRTAKLARMNQNTPLAARFMAETAHAAAKISLKQGLEFIKELYSKYEKNQKLTQVSEGSTFEELYDLSTLLPNPNHFDNYENNKTQLQDIGLSLRG